MKEGRAEKEEQTDPNRRSRKRGEDNRKFRRRCTRVQLDRDE